LLNYNELPPSFAPDSVKWPVLNDFLLKYPQLLKELTLAVEFNNNLIVLNAPVVSNVSLSSNIYLNKNSDLGTQNSNSELLNIQLFLKAFTKLIDNVNLLIDYKLRILTNEELSNYEGCVFEIINTVVTNSDFCIKL